AEIQEINQISGLGLQTHLSLKNTTRKFKSLKIKLIS
ncbi:hypothetical protein AAUPMC_20926, partial [Pasteurella multocida subsp. multocida str. Anand1_cattle]